MTCEKYNILDYALKQQQQQQQHPQQRMCVYVCVAFFHSHSICQVIFLTTKYLLRSIFFLEKNVNELINRS